MTFDILNSENKIKRTFEAQNLNDALVQVQKLIAKDGSYYVVDNWRAVKCVSTGSVKYLKRG
jgi:hypothetical protein